MTGERWTQIFVGDIDVRPTAATKGTYGDDVGEKARRRRDDILIALDVHGATAAMYVRDELTSRMQRPADGTAATIDVAVVTEESDAAVAVTVSGPPGADKTLFAARDVASALESWIASHAHRVAQWSVEVRLATDLPNGPDASAAGTEVSATTVRGPRVARKGRREQPMLWGIAAVVLLTGLTFGSVILVSVLAVGD